MANFFSWLMEQVERDDPVGDLANDTLRDKDLPNIENESLKQWLIHLKRKNACPMAIVALKDAWKEYNETLNK